VYVAAAVVEEKLLRAQLVLCEAAPATSAASAAARREACGSLRERERIELRGSRLDSKAEESRA
jgi:hypothetical protein